MMTANTSGALRQLLPAILALVGTATSFTVTAGPARAAVNGPFYSATLSRPMEGEQKVIQKGVLWKCEGAECSAPRDTSRPAIVCARLVQKVGPVTRFATPQGDLGAEDLAKCNGAAD
ncbi:hypothetical protein Saro_3326 [Novosphingobium aromaticivorans DSM 12444]|uniref:Secreted protein n=2 Tax=Novosphingobium aromaticivorans TaxID=48935 RepID=Q2G312_NOVAD|nr:hypothetical protein [Novosphingobium aromaticivorans]ABD27761.1 hypothetical protein Saro_3326 [Novosphingobium aromaticivorans DSM 12444]SCY28251.1 hypothetical protein SAMN05660666_01282 [Novosphingobium aromaticivorans]